MVIMVMNVFFVLLLVGMVYVMLGMEIKFYVVINWFGVYDGFLFNYSGVGFLYMWFKFYGLLNEEFDWWV